MHRLKFFAVPLLLLFLAGCSMEVSEGSVITQPAASTQGTVVQTQAPAQTKPQPITKPGLSAEAKAKIAEWETKIYPGTSIGKIDVSGLTLEEAKEKVNEALLAPLKERRVRFSYVNKKNYMSYERLKVGIAEDVFQAALENGKDAPEEDKLKFIENGKTLKVEPALSYDESYVEEMMAEIQEKLTDFSRQHVATRKDGQVILKENATEDVLDKEAFKAAVKEAVDFSTKNNPYIEVPVTKIPTKVTQDDLDAINTKLTSFTSYYGWSYDARKFNVGHAAKKISGSLIMPGQEFSFNQSIGGGAGTTNGFSKSAVYKGTQVVQEPGGGVCQVSSTIYNVILKLGINPTQRKNHGMSISYLPPGMDAVVYAPSLDLRFVNPFDHPIYITAKADGDALTFNVYGAKGSMGGYSYKYESEVYKEDKAAIKEVEDKTIPKGAIVLDPTPHNGSSVRVYKITYKDGKRISRKLYTDNTYRRADGVRRIGTGVGKQINKNWFKDREVLKYPPKTKGTN